MNFTLIHWNFPTLIILIILFTILSFSQTLDDTKPDWEGNEPDGCTTVMVGKLGTFDGSTMTSHTDDSHRTRSWMNIVPPLSH